jgi:hypothetical protein
MPTLGASVGLANSWLGTWRNVPYAIGLVAVQLHLAFPGADGRSGQFAVTERKQVFFDEPINGMMNISGAPPIWEITGLTGPTTVAFISAWSGYYSDVGAMYLAPGRLLSPKLLANGDKFNLGACQVQMLGLAAD